MGDRIIPARLSWQGDQPFSRQFGDIYHAPDGIAEVERVFVEPQHLDERFERDARAFTVGEVGFGTALNFAVVAHRFLERAPAPARLHFVTVEKHPVAPHEFAALAQRRARRLPIYAELARVYPPLLAGWHRRHLAGGRIMLSVFFGDGIAGFDDIVDRQRLPVDAWLLDGFAPDRNPQLWSVALWRTLARLSAEGSTLATFSAVGAVRRALADAGFSMRKVDQRPHKRHTLAGVFARARGEAYASPRSVGVVGAGLAGVATARQLAERGVVVTLLDAAPSPPNRMAATLFHPRLLPDDSVGSRLRCMSYLYSTHWYDGIGGAMSPCGALQFAGPNMPQWRLESVADAFAPTGNWVLPVDSATASSLAGLPLRRHALFFPHARALDLAQLADVAISHHFIEYRNGSRCLGVSSDADRASLTTAEGDSQYDGMVLCAGTGANGFEQARYLELLPVWGQIDRIELSRAPSMAMVGEGFMTPMDPGWGIGATYEQKPWDEARATAFNLQRFHAWWRELTGADAQLRCVARLRGSRAVASDRMPVIGTLFDDAGEPIPRLLVNTGHGSQGTVSAPFAAEWIASELCGEFAPCTRAELDAFGTMRFRLRQARRGLRHGGRE
ncbi:MAG TPA: tRNA (5-methylaminomethyl-2-thiouridine)(34)-methyltransferase MnmD [Pseudomonadales bacterium]|nr:tRNA (5-methylaminomethyl-2-thiouridine)(34)-methyltransferase MnmD [Pseudomonadales bacterium]